MGLRRPLNTRYIVIVVAVVVAVVSLKYESWAIEWKMASLCKLDGGQKIYEVVRLPPSYFNNLGHIRLGESMATGKPDHSRFTRIGDDEFRIVNETGYLVGERSVGYEHAETLTQQRTAVYRLPSLPMAELWALWDQHFPRRPNHRNRNCVESRLAYRIQELAYGALPTNIRKMLVEAGAKHSKIKSAAGLSAQTLLMPGTTLIREWDEREYRVTVTPDGLYALDGQVFKSLSAAARHITGTQWNGPKFFGLRGGKGDGQ